MKYFSIFIKTHRSQFYILLVIVISIPVILPYFHFGYFPTHDGEWAVVRLADMFRSLRDHQFPVRYSGFLNFEYGYPLFNFVYPFPYYLGVLIHFFKIGFVDAIKLIFAATVPLSAVMMFLLAKNLWKNSLAGLISATFYIYLPYRLVDLYVRGSIGESIAFVLYPLLILIFARLSADKNFNLLNIITGSIFFAVLVTVHNIMAVLFLPVLLIFILFFYIQRGKESLCKIAISIFVGSLLAAFFWLPALAEKHYILLSKIPIANRDLYFVTIKDLMIPKWGYGPPTSRNGFGYQLGWPQVIVFISIFSFLFYTSLNKKIDKVRGFKLALLLSVGVIILSLFLFSISDSLWRIFPLFKEINYPWTFLLPIGFLVSLLAGFLASRFPLLVAILALTAIIAFLPHAKPSRYINRGDTYYLTNEATTTSSSELMPLWVKDFPIRSPLNKVVILRGTGSIRNVSYNSKSLSFDSYSLQKLNVEINTIYYPGWRVYVNGSRTQISYANPRGVMDVSIPAGETHVLFKFMETPLRLASDISSAVTICFVFLFLLIKSVLMIRRFLGL